MRKNLTDIYNEMWEDPSDLVFPPKLLEKVDRFALDDYTKLIYEQSSDIFEYLDELITEGSHGDQKAVRKSLKDAYRKGLINVEEIKNGWFVKSKKDNSMLTIHKGETAFHELRRFIQRLQKLV